MNPTPDQSAAVLASVEAKWSARVTELQAEVARLRAQVQRSPEYICGADENCGQCLECAMMAQDTALQAAQAEVEALKLDKERLDTMEREYIGIVYNVECCAWGADYEAPYGQTIREGIDNAIDAAMNTTPKDQKQ